tara:strand:- start:68 stop:505 length:438 start_codon:yes stop_codon:yes gene_type:complete
MANEDAIKKLKIQQDQVDGILQAGRKEDAKSFLDTWRLNNIGTKDSGVLPPVDAVPPHLRGWIFPKADASPQESLMINDKNIAGLPYQDGRAPTHLFYDGPGFGYPSNQPFVKDEGMKDEAFRKFLINTGIPIDLVKRKERKNVA